LKGEKDGGSKTTEGLGGLCQQARVVHGSDDGMTIIIAIAGHVLMGLMLAGLLACLGLFLQLLRYQDR